MNKQVLAFDFGASSGRAVLGRFDGEKINLKEIHRFSNDPVSINGAIYWDILRLFHEIKQGILKAKAEGGFESIGIDTWGVDFGLVGSDGSLVENPVHYRDSRNAGMIAEAEKYISKDELYGVTGIQFLEFNTVFQLLSLIKNRPHIIERADKLLMLPDLLNFFLTGEKTTEYSIATTTQLVDIKNNGWSAEIMDKLNIPQSLFTPIIKTGSAVGALNDAICEELGVPKAKVIAVASHDTGSAVTAVPAIEKDFIFISSGTWSLMGTELDAPIIGEKSRRYDITNEGGYGYSVAFLKNICGLWLIQETRRQYQKEGKDYSYADLERMAAQSEPFKCFIDPDAPEFASPGDMPGRIIEYAKKTGQPVPENTGEIMRCIYESLALKYRYTLENILECTGKTYDKIHIVGGGAKDGFLSQMAANACNKTVVAGPAEATVLGNIAVQLIASGDIKSVAEAREIIAAGENLKIYEPSSCGAWDSAYVDFNKLRVEN
ncbi:MAG: rhamnulokinase [Oscillospiraceae bacterium]|nr:rhamnulokinase [Oscillospiraceae bacterium]